jgi:hypothetical protein
MRQLNTYSLWFCSESLKIKRNLEEDGLIFLYFVNTHQVPNPLCIILKKVPILVLTSWKALFWLEPTALEKVSSSKSHVTEQCHQMKGVSFWENASLNTIICDTTYPLEFRSILAHGTRKLLLLDICKTIGQARQPDPRWLGKVTYGP